MALPSSGSLAFSQIRAELTIAGYTGSYSLQAFDGMAFGGYAPHQVSEFYGYSSAPPEYMEFFIGMYETMFNGYGFSCTYYISVGVSNLGKYYLNGQFDNPLYGNYAEESGHVKYFSDGREQYGIGWCEWL